MLKAGLVELSWTFVFQLINTFIIYLLLKKLLFVPVTNFLEKRRQGIEDSIKEAERVNIEAQGFKEQYMAKLQTAEEEGKSIIQQATKNANNNSDKIIKDAKEEASKIKDKAYQDIERERKKAINEIKDDISSLAILAASKVLDKEIDSNKNKKLIDQFIEEVGEAKWQN